MWQRPRYTYRSDTLCAGVWGVLFLLAGAATAQYARTLWIPVTFYDYRADGSNPNFEPFGLPKAAAGLRQGMVRDTLDADRKPLLNRDLTYNRLLEQWYRPSGIEGTGAQYITDAATGHGTWSMPRHYQGRVNEWVGSNYSELSPGAYVVSAHHRCVVFTASPRVR